jgi:cytidylate kinase
MRVARLTPCGLQIAECRLQIWLTGAQAPTIAALVEAELDARGQRVDVLELAERSHRFGGEQLVEVFLDDPTGRPDLVIDTHRESAADAAESVLALIDGHSLP